MNVEIWYSRAPVVEAVIDIRVNYRTVDGLQERLERFAEEQSEAFPRSMPIRQLQIEANFEPGKVARPTQSDEVVGLRLVSQAGDRVLQIQRQGLTYSHLAPYTRWKRFREEAIPIWQAFFRELEVIEATRLAVRYINRIVIPHPSIELHDYFALYPKIPTNVPQDINGFFLQLRMPQADIAKDTTAVINLALGDPQSMDSIAIMLDLDVFRDGVHESPVAIWEILDTLRARKNLLFEAILLDQTKELIR